MAVSKVITTFGKKIKDISKNFNSLWSKTIIKDLDESLILPDLDIFFDYKNKNKSIKKRKLERKITKNNQINDIELIKLSAPLISPNLENDWESWQTFNPGAILLNGKVHLLYRAIGEDGLSRLGYCASNDGLRLSNRLPYPVFEHCCKNTPHFDSYSSGGSWGGCEDPRIVRIGDEDTLYLTYTSFSNGIRVGLSSIKIKDFENKKWNWTTPKLISPENEIHKNWVIFPEKINGKYAILHSINPEILIDYIDNLNFKNNKTLKSKYVRKERKKGWDSIIRGAGPPPIKTKEGWLLFYHAMDKNDYGKYKVGAMILDIKDPTKILYRSKKPVIEPKEYYEMDGFKGGVVYASGAVIKDDKLLVYFGGADNYVCLAYADINNFLKALKTDSNPQLKHKMIKKKEVAKK